MSKMGKGLRFSKVELFDINRRVIAHSTQRAWNETPHVSYVYDADVTEFFEYFKEHQKELSSKIKISFNTVMLKVIAEGLKAAPELNSILEYFPKGKCGYQKFSKDINIAIPWMMEDGKMITPVVKGVGEKNLEQITQYIEDIDRRIQNTDIDAMQYQVSMEETISELLHLKLGVLRQVIKAKLGKTRLTKPTMKQRKAYKKIKNEDKITPADIFDASMLVSNIGSIFKNQKGALTLLEIITPQVFVVGINAIQERPTVVVNKKGEKEIGIRKILPLTLSFDHRALDFGNIIPFQNKLEEIFNNPSEIKKW